MLAMRCDFGSARGQWRRRVLDLHDVRGGTAAELESGRLCTERSVRGQWQVPKGSERF